MTRVVFHVVLILLLATATFLHAITKSIGPDGINSVNLPFSGAGIGIGQVEPGRSGKPNFDSAANSHPEVDPEDVFLRNGPVQANMKLGSGHATTVAGVMISTDITDADQDFDSPTGVAGGAKLYSSATDVEQGNGQIEAAVAVAAHC